MPLISVIVPVYNAEGYLRRCVDSILAQTVSDFELILVNDGSRDNSGAMCDSYAAADPRIRVFHQHNQGQAVARNRALDWVYANSDSSWIHFVDSDDCIHPEMLERLLQGALTHRVQISVVGYVEFSREVPAVQERDDPFVLLSPEEYYTQKHINAVMPVAKLYARECFASIRYPEGRIHEDLATNYKLFFAQEQIAYSDEPLYYYYQNSEGTTKSAWTPKRLAMITAMEEQLCFFRKEGYKQAFRQATLGYVSSILQNRNQLLASDHPQPEKGKLLRNLNGMLYGAIARYGWIYLREDLGIYMEAFPGLLKVYRKIKGIFVK